MRLSREMEIQANVAPMIFLITTQTVWFWEVGLTVCERIDLPDLTILRNHKGSSFNYFGYLTIRSRWSRLILEIDVPKMNPRGIELNENNIHFKYAFSFDIKKATTFATYLRKCCPYYNCCVCYKQANYPVYHSYSPSSAWARLLGLPAPSSVGCGTGPRTQRLRITWKDYDYHYSLWVHGIHENELNLKEV